MSEQQEEVGRKGEGRGAAPLDAHRNGRATRSTHMRLLVQFEDVQRWYNNVGRGSKITADVYLRRLGCLCRMRGITPIELAKRARSCDDDGMWAYNFLIDLVTELEVRGNAGSYIHSNVKAVKSWLSHNGVSVERKVKIRGIDETPTLRGKDALTGSESQKVSDLATRQRTFSGYTHHSTGVRNQNRGAVAGTSG